MCSGESQRKDGRYNYKIYQSIENEGNSFLRRAAGAGHPGRGRPCALYEGRLTIVPALPAEKVLDTMGAGDSYLAALLCELLKASPAGVLLEGAFGCGIPIAGRTELEEWEKMKPKEVGG